MDTVARGGRFLREQGREVDRALFAYQFERGAREDVVAALGAYQNPDGGFGNALEPDIKAPVSNPFATEIALQICIQADVPSDAPLLRGTVEYLERTQDEGGSWRFSDEVYRHEIAPWFAGWTWPTLNPTVTTPGLLRQLGVGSDELFARAERAFDELATVDDLLGDQYYAARPYAFYFLPEWEHPRRELYLAGLLWWLIRQHVEGKLPDSAHFFEYVRTPDTYTGRHLPGDIVSARLDSLAVEQEEDGGWPSPYAEHWRSWSTVQNLITLKAFGRV